MKKVISLLIVIVIAFSFSACSKKEIEKPKSLSYDSTKQLNTTEEKVLDEFVSALVEAYNQGDEYQILKPSEELDNAYSLLAALAQNNDYLTKAHQLAFIIISTNDIGPIGEDADMTPEETRAYVKEDILKILSYYYE